MTCCFGPLVFALFYHFVGGFFRNLHGLDAGRCSAVNPGLQHRLADFGVDKTAVNGAARMRRQFLPYFLRNDNADGWRGPNVDPHVTPKRRGSRVRANAQDVLAEKTALLMIQARSPPNGTLRPFGH